SFDIPKINQAFDCLNHFLDNIVIGQSNIRNFHWNDLVQACCRQYQFMVFTFLLAPESRCTKSNIRTRETAFDLFERNSDILKQLISNKQASAALSLQTLAELM